MKKKVVMRVDLTNCNKCRSKALKTVAAVDGVESVSFDAHKSLMTVSGEMNPNTLVSVLRKNQDNNGGGGGKNDKKGRDHDGDGPGDKNKSGYDDGGGEMKGKNMDFMGKAGFGYRYGYHAGNENEYPVGQLQCAQGVRSSEPKCLFHHAIMIS